VPEQRRRAVRGFAPQAGAARAVMDANPGPAPTRFGVARGPDSRRRVSVGRPVERPQDDTGP